MNDKNYTLFVDDERTAPNPDWIVAKSTAEAMGIVMSRGVPSFMSLDHDLGGQDTTMGFLHWLAFRYYEGGPPEWAIHSANPVGRANLESFLKSWQKSLETTDIRSQ